ncbi:alpha/beta hydrolase [Bacillus sp. ISL-26]|nr:alpha/beta hydrolase [Bacillus sp. ISL-26]
MNLIVALCGLTVVNIPFMSAMGLTAGLSVLMAVLASITLVPAVLSAAGKRMVPKRRKKNPLQPSLENWLDTLSLYKHTLNKNTYLVAHSLGCPAILRFLERTQLREQLGGIILVSGFAESLPNLKMLDEFTEGSFDDQKLIESAKRRAVIASTDDQIVPFAWRKDLAQQIDAAFYEVQHGGHFLENEGFTSLPIVYDVLTSYFSKETR